MLPKSPPGKRKLPHKAQDIQDLEDEIARLAGDLRDIRGGMTANGLAEVMLKAGTFRFYLKRMRKIAKDFKREYESQLIELDAKKARERKLAEREGGSKKR